MRVLVLCTDAFGGYGGIAQYNRDLAEAIARHPDVTEVVMLPRLVPAPMERLPEKIRFVEQAAKGLASYGMEVAKLLPKRHEFDLIICAHVNLLPFARLLSARPVLVVYGIEAWKPPRRGVGRFVRGAGAVWSISEITLRRLRRWSGYHGPSSLLPNAIHLERYAVGPRDPELARRLGVEGKRVLLTFGRIVPAERYKGFDEVLEVLPQLVDTMPDLAYVIAGDGSDVGRLRAKAAALGVSDHVVFTGMVREEEKAALYRLADVYVMPSRGEGFGFVILEALASGVPVIASKIDGSFEAVREGMLGRVVNPSNPAEILAAIVDVLQTSPREVPPGLAHFAFDNFVSRVHSAMEGLTEVHFSA